MCVSCHDAHEVHTTTVTRLPYPNINRGDQQLSLIRNSLPPTTLKGKIIDGWKERRYLRGVTIHTLRRAGGDFYPKVSIQSFQVGTQHTLEMCCILKAAEI